MSSTSEAFGLRPAFSPSGSVRPTAYSILTGYATGILQNQPVKLGTDGSVQAAAVGDRFIGTFSGVEYDDSDGRRRMANKWTASTAGTDIVAYVTLDPTLTYEIQSNAAINLTDIGKQYDFTAASGSTTIGLSTQMLDVASSAANASLRVVGLSPGPNNAFGDTYVIVLAQISEHQNVADVAAY